MDSVVDSPDVLPGDGLCADATGDCSLRAATEEANALPDLDQIDVPVGVYELALGGLFLDGYVVLRGVGMHDTIIDANGLGRVIQAGPGTNGPVTIADLTLRGGSAVFYGAGVFAWDVSVLLERVLVQQNVGLSAVDMIPDDSTGLGLEGAIVRDNEGFGVGATDASIQVKNSLVENNTGAGIRVSSDSSLHLDGSTLRGNHDSGILMECGSNCFADIRRSAIVGNESSRGAGGIQQTGDFATSSVSDSTLSGNHGTVGGGLAVGDGIATFLAGGAYLFRATVTGNTASALGGGVAANQDQSFFEQAGYVVLENSIVAGNAAPNGPDCGGFDARATITSNGWNVVGIACDSLVPDPTDLAGSAGAPLDPLLGALDETSAPTPYHPVLAGSPASDRVPVGDCGAVAPPATDQRGATRPVGGACDVGAIEGTPCQNGADDDGDGAIDFPADTGCRSVAAWTESPRCSDGLDNDGDGAIDWNGGPGGAPPDPQCGGVASKDREAPTPACGLGAEGAGLAGLLLGATRARRNRRRT